MSNRLTAKNSWQEGLIMDFAPENAIGNSLTNALNATLITFNGNELVLQSDMGNGRVETAYLPEGFIPIGTCEFGDIIYIVSYNPLIDKAQIGSFPSPERNISSEEIQDINATISASDFQELNNEENPTGNLKTTEYKVLLSNRTINPGDKYCVQGFGLSSTFNKITTNNKLGYLKFKMIAVSDDGKITELETENHYEVGGEDYFIAIGETVNNTEQPVDINAYRGALQSGWQIFQSKYSAKLALLVELEKINSFSCGYSLKETTNNYELWLNPYWTSDNPDVYPEAIIINDNVVLNNGDYTQKNPLSGTSSSNYYVIKEKSLESLESSNTPTKVPIRSGIHKIDVSAPWLVQKGKSFWILGNTIDKESAEQNNTQSFTVTPVMPYGKLEEYAVEIKIDFSKIGTNTSELTQWKYHNTEESSTITLGLNNYNKPEHFVEKVVLEFYDNEGFAAAYHITDRNTYSGVFTNYINLNSQLNDYLTNIDASGEEQFRFEEITDITGLYEFWVTPKPTTSETLLNVPHGTSTYYRIKAEITKEINEDTTQYKTYYKALNTNNSWVDVELANGSVYYQNKAGQLKSNLLYGVHIKVFYATKDVLGNIEFDEFKTHYRWFWSNKMFNEYYYSTDDFDILEPTLNLDFDVTYNINNKKVKQVDYKNSDISDNNENIGAIVQYYDANITSDITPKLYNDWDTFELGTSDITQYIGVGEASYKQGDSETIVLDNRQVVPNIIYPKTGQLDTSKWSDTLLNLLEIYENTDSGDLWEYDSNSYVNEDNYVNGLKSTITSTTNSPEITENYITSNQDYKLVNLYQNNPGTSINLQLAHFSKYSKYYASVNKVAPKYSSLIRNTSDLAKYGLTTNSDGNIVFLEENKKFLRVGPFKGPENSPLSGQLNDDYYTDLEPNKEGYDTSEFTSYFPEGFTLVKYCPMYGDSDNHSIEYCSCLGLVSDQKTLNESGIFDLKTLGGNYTYTDENGDIDEKTYQYARLLCLDDSEETATGLSTLKTAVESYDNNFVINCRKAIMSKNIFVNADPVTSNVFKNVKSTDQFAYLGAIKPPEISISGTKTQYFYFINPMDNYLDYRVSPSTPFNDITTSNTVNLTIELNLLGTETNISEDIAKYNFYLYAQNGTNIQDISLDTLDNIPIDEVYYIGFSKKLGKLYINFGVNNTHIFNTFYLGVWKTGEDQIHEHIIVQSPSAEFLSGDFSIRSFNNKVYLPKQTSSYNPSITVNKVTQMVDTCTSTNSNHTYTDGLDTAITLIDGVAITKRENLRINYSRVNGGTYNLNITEDINSSLNSELEDQYVLHFLYHIQSKRSFALKQNEFKTLIALGIERSGMYSESEKYISVLNIRDLYLYYKYLQNKSSSNDVDYNYPYANNSLQNALGYWTNSQENLESEYKNNINKVWYDYTPKNFNKFLTYNLFNEDNVYTLAYKNGDSFHFLNCFFKLNNNETLIGDSPFNTYIGNVIASILGQLYYNSGTTDVALDELISFAYLSKHKTIYTQDIIYKLEEQSSYVPKIGSYTLTDYTSSIQNENLFTQNNVTFKLNPIVKNVPIDFVVTSVEPYNLYDVGAVKPVIESLFPRTIESIQSGLNSSPLMQLNTLDSGNSFSDLNSNFKYYIYKANKDSQGRIIYKETHTNLLSNPKLFYLFSRQDGDNILSLHQNLESAIISDRLYFMGLRSAPINRLPDSNGKLTGGKGDDSEIFGTNVIIGNKVYFIPANIKTRKLGPIHKNDVLFTEAAF